GPERSVAARRARPVESAAPGIRRRTAVIEMRRRQLVTLVGRTTNEERPRAAGWAQPAGPHDRALGSTTATRAAGGLQRPRARGVDPLRRCLPPRLVHAGCAPAARTAVHVRRVGAPAGH